MQNLLLTRGHFITGGRMKKEKYKKGILTVEFAYLLPIIFSVFLLIVYSVFYYHDKNILIGAVSETAVLWTQLERQPGGNAESDLSEFFSDRVSGKLIFFSEPTIEMSFENETAVVNTVADKGWMSVSICGRAMTAKPEETIRKQRILQNFIKQEERKDEN